MKIISVLSLILIGVLAFLVNSGTISLDRLLYSYPCNTPLAYHLGGVDPRFKLSNAQVEESIHEAVSVWNTAYGKTLFEENSSGKLTVNFVYDQRQELVNQINNQENTTLTDKSTLNAKIAAFNTKSTEFQKKVDDLNSKIQFWNKKGGAPPDVYQKLTQEQQDLQKEGQKLQTEARTLNQSTDKFNYQVNELNGSINTFNSLLSQKPEEGLFNGQDETISIYFTNSNNELIHTLTHEFGHARGLGHVNDKKAVMYPYTSEELTLSGEDLSELNRACQKISNWEILKRKLIGPSAT